MNLYTVFIINRIKLEKIRGALKRISYRSIGGKTLCGVDVPR